MSLKMAILGQLMEAPKSGYEIKAAFRDTIRNFWHVSDGQLYPTLRKLTDENLVRKEELLASNGLKKHEYSLTEAGRKGFKEWLLDTHSPVPEMKEPFLLKLMFFSHLSREEQIAHIDQQILQSADLIEDYRDSWRDRVQDEDESPYLRMVADAGLIVLEARKMYMEQLRKGIANGNVAKRIPLFDDDTIQLAKEVGAQLLDMFEASDTMSISDLLKFTKGD